MTSEGVNIFFYGGSRCFLKASAEVIGGDPQMITDVRCGDIFQVVLSDIVDAAADQMISFLGAVVECNIPLTVISIEINHQQCNACHQRAVVVGKLIPMFIMNCAVQTQNILAFNVWI